METEIEIINCAGCGKPVITYWAKNGGMCPGDYTLVADWVYHNSCWDKAMEKYEPPPIDDDETLW